MSVSTPFDRLPRSRTSAARVPGVSPWVNFAQWGLKQHQWFNRQVAEHGPAFSADFPVFGRIAVFATSTAAQQILKLPPTASHAGEAYRSALLQSTGPHSVIVLDEDEHLRMRKLLLSPLHGERLQRWESFAEQRTLEDIAEWPPDKPFPLRPATERITMAVISKIVFGMRDPKRGEELQKLLPALFDLSLPVGIGYVSAWGRLDLGPRSPWGAYRRKRDQINELIYSEITDRREELASSVDQADSDARSDVLSMLLEARDDDGRAMGDEEIRDQLVTMLIAGHETTATSIGWAFERLLRTPRAMNQLRESLESGDSTYLDAVIKETMRLRPVVAQIGRVLTEDATIDGWEIPAGTMVMVPMTVIHMDPDVYPDPEEFRPERFLGEDQPGGYSWLPFGGGVRRCPGASLALLEMRVVLRTILTNVTLTADREEPERPRVRGITLVPDRGARVIVTGRLRHGANVSGEELAA